MLLKHILTELSSRILYTIRDRDRRGVEQSGSSQES